MIRIALISDIHFGKDGRGDFTIPNESPKFGVLSTEKTMGADLVAALQEQQPEYLFIAGDLTSIGSPAEYYYCEKKVLEIAKEVNIDNSKIIWCTGNHDNDWAISKLSDSYNSTAKAELYNENIERICVDKYSQIAANVAENNIENLPFPLEKGVSPASGVYKDQHMIVFILNSATKCMHSAALDHGEITIDQLTWFENQLKNYENDSRWKIVLLHHHPFNYPYPEIGIDTSLLSDGSQFQEMAGKGGVHLVLHGHRHHPRCKTQNETSWRNPISFICAGSLSVGEKQRLDGSIPNVFHILELDEEQIGQLYFKSFEYLPGSGWAPVSKRGGTVPIDPIMRLGRIINNDELIASIESLASNTGPVESFEWDELNDELQFNPCDEVNSLIESTLKDRFIVKAKLPENLTIKRKGG